jgi:hypothetical protein
LLSFLVINNPTKEFELRLRLAVERRAFGGGLFAGLPPWSRLEQQVPHPAGKGGGFGMTLVFLVGQDQLNSRFLTRV